MAENLTEKISFLTYGTVNSQAKIHEVKRTSLKLSCKTVKVTVVVFTIHNNQSYLTGTLKIRALSQLKEPA